MASVDERACRPNALISVEQVRRHFTAATYMKAVEQAQRYIRAGDIFEVNVSQCFEASRPADFSPLALFQQLCDENAAPFSAYLRFGDHALVSSSPERFLQLRGQYQFP